MDPASFPCPDCAQTIPNALDRCPHCGRPGYFPNVRAASRAEEVQALDARFRELSEKALSHGKLAVLQDSALELEQVHAVISRPLTEVQRLASNERQGYASYYQLTDSELRIPDGDSWDAVRRLADETIFPGYREKIRFAALSLDGVGLRSYGDCSLRLRTDMIMHRATLLEENSCVLLDRRPVHLSQAAQVLRGSRAIWEDRVKLCLVKLADRLVQEDPRRELRELILHNGVTSGEDDFVEVHIYGSITIRSFDHVVITTRGLSDAAGAILAALEVQLRTLNVTLEQPA